jgi:cytochrome b involved in lipid metabolism
MEEEQNSPVTSGGSNNGILAIVILLVVVLIGVGVFLLTRKSDTPQSNSAPSTNSPSSIQPMDTTQPEASAGITSQEEVALHNKKTDCWTIINGKVYNITEYIPRHPGGDEILRACGVDGTSLFETRTTADGQKIGSGGSHSQTAQNQLKQFELGSLAN